MKAKAAGRATRGNVAVTVGIIDFPVDVLTAVEPEQHLSTLCGDGHELTPVKAPRVCPACGALDGFVKGAVSGDGSWGVVSEAEADAAGEVPDALKVSMELTVHPVADVQAQTLPGAASYYLRPAGKNPLAAGRYAVLRQVLTSIADAGLCAVTVFAVNRRPRLYQVGLRGDVVSLSELMYPQRVRELPVVPGDDAALAGWAEQVRLALPSRPFDPETYTDQVVAARAALLESAARVTVPAPVSGVTAGVYDEEFVAAIAANLAALKEAA